jgi:hypothetical protein
MLIMKVKCSSETVGELNQSSNLHLADPNDSILLTPAEVPQSPRLPSSPLRWLRIAVPFISTHLGCVYVGLLNLETSAAAKVRKVGQLKWLLLVLPLPLWCELQLGMVQEPIRLLRPYRQRVIGFLSSIAFTSPSADAGH